jgi:Resolvase, N terminal domain/Helix-turn-helix domain of resolvase
VVTVTRIDRLARSTFDLFAIVKRIVDAGGQFRSLAEPWADTATSTGRLMIAVLGGLADVERDLIRTRTAEGRSRARVRGQHMGRPPALTPQQQAEARKRRAEGATLKELAQSYNVGIATISRLSSRVSGIVHEQGGFPVERAALGSCDLSMLHIAGEWQWLVRQDGRDMAEGAAPSADDARREAEAVALRLLERGPNP